MPLRVDPFQPLFTKLGAPDRPHLIRRIGSEALFGDSPTREWVDEVLADIEEIYGNEIDPVAQVIREHARALAQRALSSVAAVPAIQLKPVKQDILSLEFLYKLFPQDAEARELMQQHGCEFVGQAEWSFVFEKTRLPQMPPLPSLAEILAGINEIKEKTGLRSQLICIPDTLLFENEYGEWDPQPCTMELFQTVLKSRLQGPNTKAKLSQDVWYANQKFYKETTAESGYYLMPLGLAPDTKSLDWDAQERKIKSLSPNFATPTMVQFMYSRFLHQATTGEYLHGSEFGWCADETQADSANNVHAGNRASFGNVAASWGARVSWSGPSFPAGYLGRAFLRNF